jgi:hypothetical protein
VQDAVDDVTGALTDKVPPPAPDKHAEDVLDYLLGP